MKCPYAVNRVFTCINKNTYNDDGYHIKTETKELNRAVFLECEKENCGAWKDGECNYGSGAE